MSNTTSAESKPLKPLSSTQQTILVVDDSTLNRSILKEMLGSDYHIVEAKNGLEGVAQIQRLGSVISLVLLDINMPEMDGFGVLEYMNKNNWIDNIPVVMVTAETDHSYLERAFDLGVTDFVNRPFQEDLVRRRVNNTIMLFGKQKALVGMVADQIREREKDNNLMINILSHIVEFRNGESGLHVMHVSTMTQMLLEQIAKKTDKFDLTHEDIARIGLASSLHDVGKISIPDEVLNKPGRLTDEEFELMKTHTSVGAAMLADVPVSKDDPLVSTAYEICRWHHERYDGRGYPDGLSGDDIPISAQAVALADVYDALTSKRVYKDAFSHEKAMRMILDGECGTFNPLFLECFIEIADDLKERLESDYEESFADLEIVPFDDTIIDDSQISSHTLEILDYEREKYRFFASLSDEMQYEYAEDPSIVIITNWQDNKFDMPEMVRDPYENRELIRIFGRDNMQAYHDALRSTTPEDPVVSMEFEANVAGKKRWLSITGRANWSTSAPLKYMGSIGKLVDVSNAHMKIEGLQHELEYDSLTGLPTKEHARKLVEERMAANPQGSFIFAVISLDDLKKIKDKRGRTEATQLVRHFGQRVAHGVRVNDIVSRMGDDEFFICMEGTIDPEPLVERVYDIVVGEYDDIEVTVSIGAAMAVAAQTAYDDLLADADKALAEVKASGKGGFALAS